MLLSPKALLTACLLTLSACVLQACEKTWGCTHENRPGPAIVSVDCVDDARTSDLGEDELKIEYKQGDYPWLPCRRLRAGNDPYTQPVCGSANTVVPQFTCGHSVGTFEIRASQNGRSAGPIEIKTRMENQCAYDPKTLYHELHLDLVD